MDGAEMQPMSELLALADDKDKLSVVCLGLRPGVNAFLVDLEYNYFIPGSPLNDLFDLRIQKWQNLPWAVMTVPMKYKEQVTEVAERNGMCIALETSYVMTAGRMEPFPLRGDNIFSIKNAPDSKGLHSEEEKKQCDAVIAEHLNTLGTMCSNCKCFHDDTFAKKHPNEAEQLRKICSDFDPMNECMLCHHPVGRLCMGGTDICPWCDCGRDPKVSPEDRHKYYSE